MRSPKYASVAKIAASCGSAACSSVATCCGVKHGGSPHSGSRQRVLRDQLFPCCKIISLLDQDQPIISGLVGSLLRRHGTIVSPEVRYAETHCRRPAAALAPVGKVLQPVLVFLQRLGCPALVALDLQIPLSQFAIGQLVGLGRALADLDAATDIASLADGNLFIGGAPCLFAMPGTQAPRGVPRAADMRLAIELGVFPVTDIDRRLGLGSGRNPKG